jgi:succinate dehydrogenase/fumarate reductase flavoprotein subunit
MYHQFKELADVDITKEPMEVGPTTHYVMGGVRVDAETQMSTLPGLFAAGECAAGINGANRLGGNSLSDLLVFGRRAGDHAARFARETGPGRIDPAQVDRAGKQAVEPFERRGGEADGPYRVQHDLQERMQDLVGIVRTESEMRRALEGLQSLAMPTLSGALRDPHPGVRENGVKLAETAVKVAKKQLQANPGLATAVAAHSDRAHRLGEGARPLPATFSNANRRFTARQRLNQRGRSR